MVGAKAQQKGIPLILTKQATLTIVDAIEGSLERGRFRQEGKLKRIGALLQEKCDLSALWSGLGLAA